MKLVIIGFGLLGSSIARAAKRRDRSVHITAIDPSESVLKTAIDLKLADDVAADIDAITPDSDWIILAAPVAVNLAILGRVIALAGPQTRLTDVGSTKARLTALLEREHPEFDRFIPAHPMAGREVSGPEHGLETLLDDKLVILTPPDAAGARHIEAASDFYASLGARLLVMDNAEEHDRLMGYASHLPHLLAFAFVNLAARGNNGAVDYQDLTGGGYRDFTRIAASDPIMWHDILMENKHNILTQLNSLETLLADYRTAIESDNSKALTALMTEARDERLRLQPHLRGQKT